MSFQSLETSRSDKQRDLNLEIGEFHLPTAAGAEAGAAVQPFPGAQILHWNVVVLPNRASHQEKISPDCLLPTQAHTQPFPGCWSLVPIVRFSLQKVS